ncbi:plasmid partitioning protein RepB [Devosia sp. BK]|nr:plasmid partitioning protein RepB [Devosia sp. BK]
MARKNPFANLMDDDSQTPGAAEHISDRTLNYTAKGASKSMLGALAEIGVHAEKLLAGQAVVEINPALIDISFVSDRLLEEEGQDYALLRDGIRDRGQDTPILVRPHPKSSGRYMVVFGHRRLRVARELGRNVRAVVKELADIDHVISQGQENSARSNLSFIEKALYARNLIALRLDDGNGNDIVRRALGVDPTTLSTMLGVASLPQDFLEAIGPAKKIGRERWVALRKLLDNPANLQLAIAFSTSDEFTALDSSDDRFLTLLQKVQSSNSRRSKPKSAPRKRAWSPSDQRVAAELVSDDRRFNLAIKASSADARAFGDFLIDRLDELYENFRQEMNATENGA